MIGVVGGFGKKHKGHEGGYGKKNISKFKKGVLAGGLLLAAGAGVWASSSSPVHKDVDTTKYQSPQEATAIAPTPQTLDIEVKPPDQKQKVAAGLKLASDVVGGDVGKAKAVKRGIDIARGAEGGTDDIQEQIRRAEVTSKARSTQIGPQQSKKDKFKAKFRR